MKTSVPAILLVAGAAVAATQAPAGDIAHMRYVRTVQVPAPAGQSYVIVEHETWRHARRDLADLRLRTRDGRPVPHALRTRGAVHPEGEMRARIVQPGRLVGRTRFWIEVPGEIPEYDRVRLDLRTRDFVAIARVEGADASGSSEWVSLGEHSLFDFRRERLGSSTVLQLPPTRFRWLRVTVSDAVRPDDIEGAFVPGLRQAAQWVDLSTQPERREESRRTVFTWTADEHVPLEGVRIDVAPDQRNFVRTIEMSADGREVARGTIRRVSRVHGGRPLDVEELTIRVPGAHAERFELTIHNGDDPPLRIERVTPRVLERRLYFEPGGETALALYFGDADARAPEYEYARLFVEASDAQPARLGPVTENDAYMPRPDLRPWSDRHPALLWTALAMAVGVIGALAVLALRHG